MGGFGTPHTYLYFSKQTGSSLRGGQLWVLRSTLTLKTTDTTLVSVDGTIGLRVLQYTCHMTSPGTISEDTPSATLTTSENPRTWQG